MNFDLLRIQRFCINDGPGIRTTVFFKGCPLHCRWCHNPESIRPKPQLSFNARLCTGCRQCEAHCEHRVHDFADGIHRVDFAKCVTCGDCMKACMAEVVKIEGRSATVTEVMEEIVRDRDYYEASGGGVTLSGGEPLRQPDALVELAGECRAEGVPVWLDTCGYATPEVFERAVAAVDGFLFDVKTVDPVLHREYTGVDNAPILANFRRAVATGKPVRMRVVTIPGMTDTDLNLGNLIDLAKDVHFEGPVDLMPYHRMGAAKYANLGREYAMNGAEPPTPARLAEIREVFQHEGILTTIQ